MGCVNDPANQQAPNYSNLNNPQNQDGPKTTKTLESKGESAG